MNEPNTLATILDKLKLIDDDLSPEDFDPAVVGDLKDKVDAIKWRLDAWNAEAAALDDWVDMLTHRRNSMLRKAEKLKEYVAHEMIQHGFETLPGEMVRVDLRVAQPSLKIELAADATAYLKYPNFVVQKTIYNWDKKALKEAMAMDGARDLPTCSLETTKFIKFEVRKRDKK
jgi:hypothetical protein